MQPRTITELISVAFEADSRASSTGCLRLFVEDKAGEGRVEDDSLLCLRLWESRGALNINGLGLVFWVGVEGIVGVDGAEFEVRITGWKGTGIGEGISGYCSRGKINSSGCLVGTTLIGPVSYFDSSTLIFSLWSASSLSSSSSRPSSNSSISWDELDSWLLSPCLWADILWWAIIHLFLQSCFCSSSAE